MISPRPPASSPIGDSEIDELQQALDALPAPLSPLDVSALDGYLCGVLLQPVPVPEAQWLRHVFDDDGAAPPAGAATDRIAVLARRRHAELASAIERRDWFDPWVFELADEGDDDIESVSQAALPWVGGFALAMERFQSLMQRIDGSGAVAPLALIYRHLSMDDLEDADDLIEEIETLEPCADLGEAVEGLVRATLLLADLADLPRRAAPAPRRRPAQGPRR